MTQLLTPHPMREVLNDEAHARPPAPISAPARLSSLTLFFERDSSGQLDAVARLARRMGAPAPDTSRAYYTGIAGDLMIRWSLHTEFVRYTFIEPAEDEPDFSRTALDRIPADWLHSLPGQLLVALHAVLLRDDPVDNSARGISERWFAGNDLIGAEIAGAHGCAYTDLRLHADPRIASGFSRFAVVDRGMGPLQTGRMLQRLFEIETYRMLALLSLPEAKQQMPRLDALSNALRHITERMDKPEHDAGELLHELAAQASAVENLVAQSQYRLSASRAYYSLVERRIAELRERRLPGLQPFHEFMEHRLAPAMETCDTVVGRQDRITARIQRTTALLRTRVEVQHEEQNRVLLASMDTRAAMQLRLQQTVEGLSVGVLTYYAVGLVGYASKALKAAGVHLNPEVVTGLAIPVAAVAVWAGVRVARRHLHQP
ncbi:DUF3422 domain-containing protein [Niveibacterium sp. 24ML]|uniref:DUF3422 family protein n=1 Tax=Niveibacterium sp. 24ML TaxID=2985512 RepID=UPI00226DE641|nr:DUF3422 domain-containing protein [Niveibacterium sp. 24ML]MCX9156287.1 DUF3422 domain-containing protein [Niveibacterium sp. 24ML]